MLDQEHYNEFFGNIAKKIYNVVLDKGKCENNGDSCGLETCDILHLVNSNMKL